MAYTKQTWTDLPSTTSPYNATRMNHIEDGIYATDTLTNTLNGDKTDMKTITFNGEWLYVHCIGGANMLLMFPIYNPDNLAVTLTLTSSELYTGTSGWVSMPVFGTGVQSYGKTFAVLRFQTPTGATLTQGYSYLMRMTGTLTIGS